MAYGVLGTSALVGLAAAVIYGVVVYGNLLALLTPHQQHEARAAYLILFATTAALLAWQRTRALGWNARQRLAGQADGVAAGIVVGALVLAVMLGYLIYVPRGGWAGPFFLDLAWPTPLRFAALAVVPIAEFYFRGFLRPALEERYGAGPSVVMMALVWSLAFATPIAALLPIGLALAEIDRRRPNGLTAVVALWIAWIGLAVTVLIAPYVRGLFL
jgi:membrane protease YdiL (CAAX protease family)